MKKDKKSSSEYHAFFSMWIFLKDKFVSVVRRDVLLHTVNKCHNYYAQWDKINARKHAIIIIFKNRQNQFKINNVKINDISDETLKMLGFITEGPGPFLGVNIYKSVLKINCSWDCGNVNWQFDRI